jgi:hypothetical protein
LLFYFSQNVREFLTPLDRQQFERIGQFDPKCMSKDHDDYSIRDEQPQGGQEQSHHAGYQSDKKVFSAAAITPHRRSPKPTHERV